MSRYDLSDVWDGDERYFDKNGEEVLRARDIRANSGLNSREEAACLKCGTKVPMMEQGVQINHPDYYCLRADGKCQNCGLNTRIFIESSGDQHYAWPPRIWGSPRP